MAWQVRLMRRKHVAQVEKIEREAFPTMWPPVNFQHELQNSLAHYIVVCGESEILPQIAVPQAPLQGFPLFLAKVKSFFSGDPPDDDPAELEVWEEVLGFLGFWLMADEAHVINLAVRGSDQREGIGELLLIAGIDKALERKARILTLEVRPTNIIAQRLYAKYGFIEVGRRHAYYTDNKEDAVIMSTDNIAADFFQTHFKSLKEIHLHRLGIAGYSLTKPATT